MVKIAVVLEKNEYLEDEFVKNNKGEILMMLHEDIDMILSEEDIKRGGKDE